MLERLLIIAILPFNCKVQLSNMPSWESNRRTPNPREPPGDNSPWSILAVGLQLAFGAEVSFFPQAYYCFSLYLLAYFTSPRCGYCVSPARNASGIFRGCSSTSNLGPVSQTMMNSSIDWLSDTILGTELGGTRGP